MNKIELIWNAGFNRGFIEKQAKDDEINRKALSAALIAPPITSALLGAGMAKPGYGLKGALYGAALGAGLPMGALLGGLGGVLPAALVAGDTGTAPGFTAGATVGGLGSYYAIKKLFGDKFLEETFG